MSILLFILVAAIFNSELQFESELYFLFKYYLHDNILLFAPIMSTVFNNWFALLYFCSNCSISWKIIITTIIVWSWNYNSIDT